MRCLSDLFKDYDYDSGWIEQRAYTPLRRLTALRAIFRFLVLALALDSINDTPFFFRTVLMP